MLIKKYISNSSEICSATSDVILQQDIQGNDVET